MFLSIADVEKYKNVIPFYLSFIEHELGNTNQSIQYGEAYLRGGDKIHQTEMLQLLGSMYFNTGNETKAVGLYEQLLGKGIVLTNVQNKLIQLD